MIVPLDYFPPQGTRYDWHPPVLRHRPWWHVRKFTRNFQKWDPRSLVLEVARDEKGYRGYALFYDTLGNKHEKRTRVFKDALRALRRVEDLGDQLLAEEDRPEWVDEALERGWRPPARDPLSPLPQKPRKKPQGTRP